MTISDSDFFVTPQSLLVQYNPSLWYKARKASMRLFITGGSLVDPVNVRLMLICPDHFLL